MNHAITLALALASIAAAIASCSKQDGRVPVVVYSPHGEDILREFERMFETAHPEVDIRTFNQPAQNCFTRIRAERENPSCDVWWGAPDKSFARAAAEGLLEPYRPSYAANLPATAHDAEFHYTGQFEIPQIILFNKDKMAADAPPKSWDELATDAWRGRIVMRDPLASGSLRTAFSWLIAAKDPADSYAAGFEWLRGMTRNTKKICANPQELFEAITKDQANVVAIWNLADAIFQRDRYGFPFAISIPREGVPIVIDGIALVKRNAADPARAEAARRFYEFVNTLDSAQYLAANHGRIPLRTDFTADRHPAWFAGIEYRPLEVDPAIAAANEDAWMKRWDEQLKGLVNQ
jgi:iron(III) transport system substrate-binding protein